VLEKGDGDALLLKTPHSPNLKLPRHKVGREGGDDQKKRNSLKGGIKKFSAGL